MKNKLTYIYLAAFALIIYLFLSTLSSHLFPSTWLVATGDKISITTKTNSGYSVSMTDPFIISKDGTAISQGTFLSGNIAENYRAILASDNTAIIIEEKTIENTNIHYMFFKNFKEDKEIYEYVYIITFTDNHKTGIRIETYLSEKAAKDMFENLIIKKV